MLNSKEDKDWRKVILWLRRTFPLHGYVSVRTTNLPEGIDGETRCEDKDKRIQIRIAPRMLQIKIDTLLHEWAHALIWYIDDSNMIDHSEVWGWAYSKIYDSFVKWNFGE